MIRIIRWRVSIREHWTGRLGSWFDSPIHFAVYALRLFGWPRQNSQLHDEGYNITICNIVANFLVLQGLY